MTVSRLVYLRKLQLKEGSSFRYKVYSVFGVRSIFRGSLSDRPHVSARQRRFESKIWVSRRCGKSSTRLIKKAYLFMNRPDIKVTCTY